MAQLRTLQEKMKNKQVSARQKYLRRNSHHLEKIHESTSHAEEGLLVLFEELKSALGGKTGLKPDSGVASAVL